MKEKEDIFFESMPAWGNQNDFTVQEEKEYSSLYDEIADKCYPDRYLDTNSDKMSFPIANSIYSELTKRKRVPDDQLKDLRDKAIFQLGVHFSAKKKYEYLLEYFDPRIYTKIEPYPADRVALAKHYYDLLIDNRDDIIALEQLENEAKLFIAERKKEINREEELFYKKLNEANRIKAEKEAEEKAKLKKDMKSSAITFFALIAFILLMVFLNYCFMKQ